MQVFFILFSVHFAVYQYINSKCLYRTHVKVCLFILLVTNNNKKSVNFRYASSDSLRSSTTYYQPNVCTKAHA